MPELPEVEVVRRGLELHAVGRVVETVRVLHPRAVRRHLGGPDDFAARLTGRRLAAARRRGKYLWLPLSVTVEKNSGHRVSDQVAECPDLSGVMAAEGAGGASVTVGGGLAFAGEGGVTAAVQGGTASRGGGVTAAVQGGTASRGGGVTAAVQGGTASRGGGVTAAVQGGTASGRGDTTAASYVGATVDSRAEDALLAHLGMSGQLVVGEPDRPFEDHLRVRFTFTDSGPDLRFVDQRTFGHLIVVADGADLPAPIAHIAPDPLEAAFDAAVFAAALRRRHTGVKRALLDQSLISGVGNIYADEALWRARLHGARPTETLNRSEIARLLAAIREVMWDALTAGGTSFDSLYVNVNGESGHFDRSLAVYGRQDRPCPRCGTPIRRDAFMNRSSYTCPHCQPRPRRAHY